MGLEDIVKNAGNTVKDGVLSVYGLVRNTYYRAKSLISYSLEGLASGFSSALGSKDPQKSNNPFSYVFRTIEKYLPAVCLTAGLLLTVPYVAPALTIFGTYGMLQEYVFTPYENRKVEEANAISNT